MTLSENYRACLNSCFHCLFPCCNKNEDRPVSISLIIILWIITVISVSIVSSYYVGYYEAIILGGYNEKNGCFPDEIKFLKSLNISNFNSTNCNLYGKKCKSNNECPELYDCRNTCYIPAS